MNIQILWKFLEIVVVGVIFVPLVYYANALGKQIFEKQLIKVKYHAEDIEMVQYGDWIDLRSSEDAVMKAGESRLISLGVSMELPVGFEAHVVPRSSTFKTWGILQTNSMGVIDNKFSGNGDIWKFPVYATQDTEIKKGDRICQFRIVEKSKMKIKAVDDLGNNNRGGFGSTGNK